MKLEYWKIRYQRAHRLNQIRTTPTYVKDHGFLATKFPKAEETNGLQMFVKNFCIWNGHFANRINTQGQFRVEKVKLAFGNFRNNVSWTPSTTRKGTADTDINLKHSKFKFGIPVKAEIKAGKDRQRDEQKEFEQWVTETGAIYIIVDSPETWLKFYDNIMQDDEYSKHERKKLLSIYNSFAK